MEKSVKYNYVTTRYASGTMTFETVRGWVYINDLKEGAGITREEFKEITGEDYEV